MNKARADLFFSLFRKVLSREITIEQAQRELAVKADSPYTYEKLQASARAKTVSAAEKSLPKEDDKTPSWMR